MNCGHLAPGLTHEGEPHASIVGRFYKAVLHFEPINDRYRGGGKLKKNPIECQLPVISLC